MSVAASAPEILEFNRAICEALGFDPQKVTDVHLRMGVGEIPTVTITHVVETTEIGAAAKSFKASTLTWEARPKDA